VKQHHRVHQAMLVLAAAVCEWGSRSLGRVGGCTPLNVVAKRSRAGAEETATVRPEEDVCAPGSVVVSRKQRPNTRNGQYFAGTGVSVVRGRRWVHAGVRMRAVRQEIIVYPTRSSGPPACTHKQCVCPSSYRSFTVTIFHSASLTPYNAITAETKSPKFTAR
jgi:hypothetical protein